MKMQSAGVAYSDDSRKRPGRSRAACSASQQVSCVNADSMYEGGKFDLSVATR